MPSRKQRRRREKERRHEYEVVYVDDEGRELDPEQVKGETRAAKDSRRREQESNGRQRPARQPARQGGSAATLRAVPPPSWRRVLRRGAIFAPFMFLTLWLLGKGHLTSTAIVLETIWLLALFVPFSYAIDRMMYRRYLKQTGGAPPARQPRA